MPVPDKAEVIRRPSARMLVFEQLREWIEDGTLASGEVMKEVEIAEKLGVSRTPVREAFQMLEQLGAIETAPSRHTRVAGVGPHDASLIYPALAALESLAVELATPKATDDDLARMAEANEALLEAASSGEPVAARDADDAFHAVLIERAGNPYLSTLIDSLHIHSRRLDTLYFTHLAPTQDSYSEHQAIIDAVSHGEVAAARDLTRLNFLRSVEVFLQNAVPAS
jgi:DNA-binding GntR family transcriptional regulator